MKSKQLPNHLAPTQILDEDAFLDQIRTRMATDNNWKLISKDNPDFLRKSRESGAVTLNRLEIERLERYHLAEQLLYALHQIGLEEFLTEDQCRYTSWDLVTTVGGMRGAIQDAYTSRLRELSDQRRGCENATALLDRWCRWEIGARGTKYGSKLEARRSLLQFMSDHQELMNSFFLADIISDRFFPTAGAHRSAKARREWRMVLAGIHLLVMISRTEVYRVEAGKRRKVSFMDLLELTGRELDEAVELFRRAILPKRRSERKKMQHDAYNAVLNRWVKESHAAVHDKYDTYDKLDNDGWMWQSRPMKDEFRDGADEPEQEKKFVDLWVEQLAEQLVPKAYADDIRRIEQLLRMAQRRSPEDRYAFAEHVNRILDSLGLRIQTEDGTQHRLAVKNVKSGKGCIQLSGKGSGKTKGFKSVLFLNVVPVKTTFIGSNPKPDSP